MRRSTLTYDSELLEEVKNAYGFKTKTETVNYCLQEVLREKKKQDLIALFGTVDYDYDYKDGRKKGNNRLSEENE